MLSMGTRQRACAAGFVVAVAICGVAGGQDASRTLESQLKTILKITEVEWVGNNVTRQGTVVRLTQGNLLFATPRNQRICAATVTETDRQIPGSGCRFLMKAVGAFLQAGQKLYITKIRANMAEDIVSLDLVEAAIVPSGVPAQPSFGTGVKFVFSKGYLGKADAGQIAEMINSLLPVDTGQAPPPQQAAAPEPPAMQPPSAPAAPVMPAQVELGMTEDQVKAILGPPTKASQPKGNMKVYTYHRQITFEDGKVSAIE